MINRFATRHATAFSTAVLVLTLATAAVAVGVLVAVPGLPGQARAGLVSILVTVLPYGLVGSWLIGRRPDLPFGWLLGAAVLAQGVGLAAVGSAWVAVSHGHQGPLVLWGFSLSGLMFVPIAVQGLINVRFPSGRTGSRWGAALEMVLITGTTCVVLGGLLGTQSLAQFLPGTAPSDLRRPLIGAAWVGHLADAMIVFAPIVVLLGLVAGIGVVVRCWRATGIERQQLKWRAAGVVVSLSLFPLAVTERLNSVVDSLDSTVFVATLAIPVLRYRLWDIDVIIRRSAVYAAVTAALIGVYALITALATELGAGLASQRVGASVAAATVALALIPVRTASQRLVDHLFYGDRRDPYKALRDVGRRLEIASGDVLPEVVAAVAASLRLPYVAIERPDDGAVLACSGVAPDPVATLTDRWPLTYQGTTVGFLLAAPRRGEGLFDDRDRAVLADLARQAGPAVRAEALTADLLDSRQRLVSAREEERRRLRRDLHDGLGPMLTGLGLNLDAGRARLSAGDRDRAVEFLSMAKEACAQAISDLRGLVYDLRPPALDDLGLVGAITLHGERLGAGVGLCLDVDAEGLPELPAAVEVAAFRTTVEAINNAVRHGGAQHCTVRLVPGRVDRGGQLLLQISDDGRSAADWLPGIGLTAMRERAEELGGTLDAGPSPEGGRVVAHYPLTQRQLTERAG